MEPIGLPILYPLVKIAIAETDQAKGWICSFHFCEVIHIQALFIILHKENIN